MWVLRTGSHLHEASQQYILPIPAIVNVSAILHHLYCCLDSRIPLDRPGKLSLWMWTCFPSQVQMLLGYHRSGFCKLICRYTVPTQCFTDWAVCFWCSEFDRRVWTDFCIRSPLTQYLNLRPLQQARAHRFHQSLWPILLPGLWWSHSPET